MNSKQLAVFCEVMLTGSFSEASRNLHRTQPAISAMIASLEADLGYKLFLRRGGRLLPVPEAHYLFAEAQEIMEKLRATQQNMTRLGRLEEGVLRIVAMPGPSVILLPRIIARFVQDRPKVRVTLLTRDSLQVQHLVATQQFDLGLADFGDAPIEASNLIEQETIRYECLCALPSGQPLTGSPVITPPLLRDRDMAALFPSHHTWKSTQAAFAAHGMTFEPRFETQYFFPLLSFVEHGLACAIIDPLSAASHRLAGQGEGGVVFRPFEPSVPFLLSLVRPRHRPLSKLTQAFLELLRHELHGFVLTA